MMELSDLDWLTFVRREYLDEFIAQGGASVKFVIPYPPLAGEGLHAGLRAAAEEGGFQFAFADSAATRIHLIDRLFHDVARQIDWDALASAYLVRLLSSQGYRLPADPDQLDLAALASANERAEPSLRQDIFRDLEREVFRDYAMSQEFRLAMIALCRSQLDRADDPVATATTDWLLGNPVRLSSLKAALIFQRIARHNARYMLSSLSHWLRLAGRRGLILGLDVTRYALNIRPADRDGRNAYSAAAAMDAYEVLRQLVDGTDDMEATFIAIIAGPAFLTDELRGVRRYPALELRIADDVHDQYRVNPLASLVRLQHPGGASAPTEGARSA
jgi:hypothetical protein